MNRQHTQAEQSHRVCVYPKYCANHRVRLRSEPVGRCYGFHYKSVIAAPEWCVQLEAEAFVIFSKNRYQLPPITMVVRPTLVQFLRIIPS